MYIKQAATVTWRPALFYCLYDSRLCTYGLSSPIPAKRHPHNPQSTSPLIGISTILQRYFNDISTMYIVEVSYKYRYTVVEIWGFEWADRPDWVFMVQSNTCVSLVYFIWILRDYSMLLYISKCRQKNEQFQYYLEQHPHPIVIRLCQKFYLDLCYDAGEAL